MKRVVVEEEHKNDTFKILRVLVWPLTKYGSTNTYVCASHLNLTRYNDILT